jgi:hypothetical protein
VKTQGALVLVNGMKAVTVTATQPVLRKLVEGACEGAQVVLAYGDKKVKLERHAPSGGPIDFDIEEDSSELEAELLKVVQGPFTPYSRRDLESTAWRSRRPE